MTTIIIILVIMAIVWFKFGRTILLLINVFRHKAFSCNPNKTANLSYERQLALSAALIIAEQNMFYTDTLETTKVGAIKAEQKQRLRSAWGIYSTDSALARLKTFGLIHQEYNAAIQTFLAVDKSQWQSYIELHFPEMDQNDIYNYTDSLQAVSATLIEYKIAADSNEVQNIFKRGALAWDLGRLVYIARASYTCGYITAEQAWQSIDSIMPQLSMAFTSWNAFGQSYMLGRSIWSHDDGAISGLFDIYFQAISDPKSPWLKYPLPH